ncbi:MAG: class I SAM-dependent methyltransferase [Actinomycetota bacterium]
MTSASSSDQLGRANDKRRRAWAKRASNYDKSIGFFERRIFGTGHREWACSKAAGDVLEIAVGTGLNLPHYPEEVRVTGLDLSPEMLEIARTRAGDLGRRVELREGDAHALPLPDASFDAVVCTYSLCNIPNPALAISEMKRVLRAGGKLILVDHIRSVVKPIVWFQKAVEFFSMRFEGEHLTRRPLEQVTAAGFEVTQKDRLARGGVVERLVATKANS